MLYVRASHEMENSKMRKLAFGVFAALALAGCQTVEVKPVAVSVEIGADPDTITNEVLASRAPYGYIVKTQTQNQLILERAANQQGDTMVQVLYGSRFNGVPAFRMTLTYVGKNPTTVYAAGALITNPNSGFEQASITFGPEHKFVQNIISDLEAIKARHPVKK